MMKNQKDIYESYQDNQPKSLDSANDKNTKKPRLKINFNKQTSNKVVKIAMIVSLILVLVGVGGFALVYTGVIKFNQIFPESILLNASNIGIKKGKSYQYDYQVYPEGSTKKNVYYESSDPSVAEVNSTTGYITPKKEGTTTIYIKSTADDTVVEKSNLSVTNEKIGIEDIKLSSERIVFDLSNKSTSQLLKVLTEPYNATSQDLSFSSSDESVAIVDQSGKVYPVGYGVATIAVRAKDSNASATCEVIVTDSANKLVYFELPDKGKIVFPYSIQLETNYLKLKYGTSRKVGFILLPPDVTEDVVTWISSDPSVATVKEGLVEGVAIGTTTITARTVNDLVAKLTVEVTDEEVLPTYVSFNDDRDEMEIGESKRLNITYDPNATMANFSWSSSNPNVISVDEQGVVTALSKGSAVITVKPLTSSEASPMSAKPMANTIGDSITIVSDGEELPSFLVVKEANIELGTGTSRTIEVEGDTGNTNYTFRSNNESVATVSSKGVVYGVSVGNAVITIMAANGVTTSVNVNVVNVLASNIVISAPNGNVVKKGEEKELLATVYPANATDRKIIWTSSNPNVLTVNKDTGVVKGISIGESTVTASVNSLSHSMVIKVSNEASDGQATTSKVLSDTQIESLKKVPITFTRESDTKIKITLDLDKYGYSDYVTLSKTKFSIVDKESSIKNVSINNVKKMPTSKNITFKAGSYGKFGVKASVYLPGNKKWVEIETATYTIREEMTLEATIPVGTKTSMFNYFTASEAKNITDWQNSAPNIVQIVDNSFEGLTPGIAVISGSSSGYVFTIKITVTSPQKEVLDPKDYTFIYDKCYSAYDLCQGGTLVNTSINKNTKKCSSDAPYYIDKQKTKYSFKCKNGDVSTTYSGESTYAIIDNEIKFDHTSNTSIRKGEEITIKISNWEKLNLGSATINNSLDNSTQTIKKASFKVAVPAGATAKSLTLRVEATTEGKNPKVYKGILVLSISEEPLLTDIKCETNNTLTLASGSAKALSCVLIDSSNNAEIKITSNDNPEYSSNKTSVATIDQNGIVNALKKGTATITVKAHGLKRKVTLTVTKGETVYNYLAIKLNKTSDNSKNQIMVGEDGVTLSYTLKTSKDAKNKITSGLTVVYSSSNSAVVEIEDNRVIAKSAGTATITGTYVNANGSNVTASVDVTVLAKGSLEPKIESLNCGPRLSVVLNDNSLTVDCKAHDAANDRDILPSDGLFTYTVKDKSILSIDSKTGAVTPKKKGKTEITVKINGYKKSATINAEVLTDKYTYTQVKITNLDNVELKKGESLDITYSLTTSDNHTFTSDKYVKFESSNEDVISVKDNKITALKKGTATITLRYKNPGEEKALTDKKVVTVYVDKTCYRYKKVTIDGWDACKDGYGFNGSDEKNCYRIVPDATSKETCEYKSGQKLSQRKWTNGQCLDWNDRYSNKKSPHEAEEYTYTADKKKTQGNTFDPSKDEIICRNACTKEACVKN